MLSAEKLDWWVPYACGEFHPPYGLAVARGYRAAPIPFDRALNAWKPQ